MTRNSRRRMGNMSLFPAVSANRGGNLLEFRTGRMNKEGKMVVPDVRKGLVYMALRDDLLHFCWKDRKTNKEEEDLVVIPSDAEFVKVRQTTQRVYMLVFKGTSQRFFFWMQEPAAEMDQELIKKVNYLINNPPASNNADPFAGVNFDKLDDLAMEISNTPKETEGDRTRQPADTSSSSSTATTSGGQTTAAPVGGHPPTTEELTALQELLSGIRVPDTVNLHDVLTTGVLTELLADPQALDKLKPFLPEPHTPEALQSLVRSPQFAQALQAFNAALRSGQVAPAELGVCQDTKLMAGVEAFLNVLQAETDKQEGNSSSSDPPQKDEDTP